MYLKSFTWGRNSIQTQTEPFTVFQQRNNSSVLEVLTHHHESVPLSRKHPSALWRSWSEKVNKTICLQPPCDIKREDEIHPEPSQSLGVSHQYLAPCHWRASWLPQRLRVSTRRCLGCHHDRHRWPWPQLRTDASTMEDFNMVHSDSRFLLCVEVSPAISSLFCTTSILARVVMFHVPRTTLLSPGSARTDPRLRLLPVYGIATGHNEPTEWRLCQIFRLTRHSMAS